MANLSSILVVEDDEALRTAYQEALEGLGHTVLAFDHTTAASWLNERTAEIAVAVIDVDMPGMVGVHLARTVKAHMSGARLVMLVRNHLIGRAVRTMIADADCYVANSTAPAELTRIVQRLLCAAQADQDRRKHQALATLADVKTLAAQSADLDSFANTLVQLLKDAFLADRVSLMLVGDDGEKMVLTASVGLPANLRPGLAVPIDGTIAGQSLSQQRPLLLNGPQLHSRSPQPIQSALVVPLNWHDNRMGVLNVSRLQAVPFTEEDLALLEKLAQPIAAALWMLSRSLLPV